VDKLLIGRALCKCISHSGINKNVFMEGLRSVNMKEWLGKLALVIITILSPIYGVLISVGFLVLADMVTGVWAAIKRGEKFSSAKLRNTVSKFLIYNIAVISGFLVETYLMENLVPVTKIIAGVIGIVELKSVLENGNAITGTDLFKEVVARLGSSNLPKDK
jgi:sugar phosphate permease